MKEIVIMYNIDNRKKAHVLIVILLTLSVFVIGSGMTPPKLTTWGKAYTTGDYEYPYFTVETTDSHFLIGGYLLYPDREFLIVKSDADDGNVLWKYTYGGSGHEYPGSGSNYYNAYRSGNGTFTFGGGSNSFSYKNWFRGIDTVFDFLLFNISDDDGDVNWARAYRGDDNDYLSAIQLINTYYVLGGFTESFSTSQTSFLVIKTVASNGNVSWVNVYDSGGSDNLRALVEDGYGNYVLGGNSNSSGNYDMVVVKVDDTDGNIDSTLNKDYGGSGDDYIQFLLRTPSDNGYLFGGSTYSYDYPAGSGRNCILVKTDSNGNVGSAFPGTFANVYDINARSKDRFHTAILVPGGYIVGGITNPGAGSTEIDGFLMKIDLTGDLVWTKIVTHDGDPGDNVDYIHGLDSTADGSIIIANSSQNGFPASTKNNFVLIKADSNGEVGGCSVCRNLLPSETLTVTDITDTISVSTSGMRRSLKDVSGDSNFFKVITNDITKNTPPISVDDLCP